MNTSDSSISSGKQRGEGKERHLPIWENTRLPNIIKMNGSTTAQHIGRRNTSSMQCIESWL